jgi:hypothetical protein
MAALDRYRDFVMAASAHRVVLLDDSLGLKYEWSSAGTIVLAQATENYIVVVDGVLDPQTWAISATIRQLALTGDGIAERAAVQVPIALLSQPSPKLAVWEDLVLLTTHNGSGWQECRATLPDGEITCGRSAWNDLNTLPEIDQQAMRDLSFVKSGVSGYAVIVPHGCAVWTRRFARSGATAPSQFVVPSGSSGLGFVYDPLLVKQRRGDVYMLTSGLVDGDWWGEGEYRIALRQLALSESAPVQQPPMLANCWSDVARGVVFRKQDGLRPITAADVDACVAEGEDPDSASNCGLWTRPLSVASRLDNAGAARSLISAGAQIDARDAAGETALHKAARYAPSDATLRALLEGGADVTLHDDAGQTAWDYAKENESLDGSDVLHLLRGN